QDRPQKARRPLSDDGVGEGQSKYATGARRDQADLDREPVLIEVRLVDDLADVLRCRSAVRVLERADDHLSGGDEQECERVREEREDAEPDKRKTLPAGTCVRPECALSFSLCRQLPATSDRRPLGRDLRL